MPPKKKGKKVAESGWMPGQGTKGRSSLFSWMQIHGIGYFLGIV